MKVRCYKEGYGEDARDYDDLPAAAVAKFARDDRFRYGEWSINVCVEPLDDEARALPGWHSDDDAERFKMYVARPSIEWSVREVPTFSTARKEPSR